jgi:hypothetical protein
LPIAFVDVLDPLCHETRTVVYTLEFTTGPQAVSIDYYCFDAVSAGPCH